MTQAQLSANQQNAQHSTGPRTPEGKARSSQNALKYGLTSKEVLLPFEDPADLDALRDNFIRQLRPANAGEMFWVEEITATRWQVLRVEAAQRTFLENRVRPDHPSGALGRFITEAEMQKFLRYGAHYRRAFDKAWQKLAQLQRDRKRDEAAAAAVRNEPKASAAVAAASAAGTAKLRNEPAAASVSIHSAPKQPSEIPLMAANPTYQHL